MDNDNDFMSNLVSQMTDEELDILFTSFKETEEQEERDEKYE